MSSHERFEELSALAVIGQLSGEELGELNAHLATCSSCKAASSDFAEILHSELPVLHEDHESLWSSLKRILQPDNYTRHFLANAKARGFSFSEGIERKDLAHGTVLRAEYALIGALVIISLSSGLVAIRWKHAYERLAVEHRQTQPVVQSNENEESLRSQMNRQAELVAAIREELATARAQLNAALAKASKAERQQEISSGSEQRLHAAVDAESAKNSELSNRLDAESRRTAALSDELQKVGANRAADGLQMAAYQKRIDELSQQLDAQTDVLNNEKQLLSADRDIRDLMGARSLHVIDVFDTDLKGRNQKAYGRVFYTEGKSLIFYAYDLNNEKVVNASYSYQAWGVRDGSGKKAKSLGIFYADDKALKRWVLKIEDPAALQQIDSVFVTVEPSGGAKQPTGHKLLYAFLKNQANHP